MLLQEDYEGPENIFSEIFNDLEKFCIVLNEFIETFFIFLKYIFVFILFSLGLMTLFKLRKIYFEIRVKNPDSDKDPLKNERLTIGLMYIFLGLGILFNYLTYFLIWALDPLPDRFIFKFLNFHGGIDPENMNRVDDIASTKYPHEKTIYYCFALCSFSAFLHLLINIWLLINNRGVQKPERAIRNVMAGVCGCIMFGFTTFLPLFLQ